MHNDQRTESIPGDARLRQNLDPYYQWAKTHNSLLIVTFDENDDKDHYHGLTNPLVSPDRANPPVDKYNQHLLDLQNRIVTIFAGAHIKPGLKPDAYAGGKGITHVNILRTIEAMYGCPNQAHSNLMLRAPASVTKPIVTDVFEPIK